MDLFVRDDLVDALEARCTGMGDTCPPEPLLELAWHFRQRDMARAIAIARHIEGMVPTGWGPTLHSTSTVARVLLIRAEVDLIHGKLSEASGRLLTALLQFTKAGDATGAGDTHWLAATVQYDQGDEQAGNAELEKACICYMRARDATRMALVAARQQYLLAFDDPQAALSRIATKFPSDVPMVDQVATYLHAARAVVAQSGGNFRVAVEHCIRAFDTAQRAGNLMFAVTAASNTSNHFYALNDLGAALDWAERGLALARQLASPLHIGHCLVRIGNTLRGLKRYQEAQVRLREALPLMVPFRHSFNYVTVLDLAGSLALDTGDAVEALRWFVEYESLACRFDARETLAKSQLHLARTLSALGRATEAHEKAESALHLARASRNAEWELEALRILARLHRQHDLGDIPDRVHPSAALHFSTAALSAARTIEDYLVPAELLEEVAADYAAVGDHAAAYRLALEAGVARECIHTKEATDRANAMQVRHDLEKLQREAEHHRQLGHAESERAKALLQANATLEELGAIGREITASLNADAVFEALQRHVQSLMDAFSFAIFKVDAACENQTLIFGVEGGVLLPRITAPLRPNGPGRLSIKERRTVVVNATPGSAKQMPGTVESLSALIAPLFVGDRVFGLMTIQSPWPNAYGEREMAIFKTLCAYGAIALDNANAYTQLEASLSELKQSQARLEEMSLTDPLTGLRNRRFLLQHLDADLEMAIRHYRDWLSRPDRHQPVERDVLFFLVDLDHFKAVNDTLGHAAGDQVLIQMRQRLVAVFRATDYLIRWGGEEFLIVARHTSRQEAAALAERICAVVAGAPFELEGSNGLPVRCSVGYACFPLTPRVPDCYSWGQTVEMADQCLYVAKRKGRNTWSGVEEIAVLPEDMNAAQLVLSPMEAHARGLFSLRAPD